MVKTSVLLISSAAAAVIAVPLSLIIRRKFATRRPYIACGALKGAVQGGIELSPNSYPKV
jgi:hypothetical protein